MRVVHTMMAFAVAAAMAGATTVAKADDKKIRVQMQSNFATSVSVLGQNAKYTAETIERVSGGSIEMKFFEPGALVPAGQSFDAVASGALDAAWATPGFWTGKDIAFAVFSAVPFGPDGGEFLAWMKSGGGENLMQ